MSHRERPAARARRPLAAGCTLERGVADLLRLQLEVCTAGLEAVAVSSERLIDAFLFGLAPELTLDADLYPVTAPLRVDRLVPGAITPGNVGICLSGGGSRAMIAGMGQLRALKALGLLERVKAISSVSGGSWLAVPFTYLPPEISDDQFLNGFVPDPGSLVLGAHGSPAERLEELPPGNLGRVAADPSMAPAELAVQGLELMMLGVPPDRLWSQLVADNVLAPFGLASFDRWHLPTSFFTFSPAMAKVIRSLNPRLGATAHTYRQPALEGDVRRPFHLCNASMFVCPSSDLPLPAEGELLAPLQSNAFFTGIVGRDLGTDAGGVEVGGGGVSSFAFASRVQRVVAGEQVEVRARAPLALSDVTGMSSAFFAGPLSTMLPELDVLDPAYRYWPVDGAAPGLGSRNRFADGGDLENNGVASLLAYEDVEKLVVFINSTPLLRGSDGQVRLDDWLSPLFGFTPYQPPARGREGGYVLYDDIRAGLAPLPADADALFYQNNQVFPSRSLEPLLEGLWSASGGAARRRPATFFQQGLEVLDNSWFGVRGGRRVDVLWIVLNPAREWEERLRPEVRAALPAAFPNYGILETHLPPVAINLLAHFTSWVVSEQAETLAALFDEP